MTAEVSDEIGILIIGILIGFGVTAFYYTHKMDTVSNAEILGCNGTLEWTCVEYQEMKTECFVDDGILYEIEYNRTSWNNIKNMSPYFGRPVECLNKVNECKTYEMRCIEDG